MLVDGVHAPFDVACRLVGDNDDRNGGFGCFCRRHASMLAPWRQASALWRSGRIGHGVRVLVDTHAHINGPEFESDLSDVLDRAAANRVGRIVCVGYDVAT